MGKKHGARSKTTAQNIQKQAPETGAKSKNIQSKNGNYDGFCNPTKSSSVEKRDSWDIPENTKALQNTLVMNYGDLFQAILLNVRMHGNKGAHTNRGNRTLPLVGASFPWDDSEDFPALQNNVPIVENVWVKRKEKLEGRKAMQPSNQTEEEFMIQKAIELSKMDALESEDKKKKLEQNMKFKWLFAG
ncbi:uncharacterized protein CEXT_546721 [Caerostris extrusa]|uniref:Uncharacterized protein n=1 Tax=Caerostris extrusa TaxID=172846 RepID=A0AAV4VTW3_CAEEX|nr:uncharacterized protein CEXT_546721 [Caerostris extrusa]